MGIFSEILMSGLPKKKGTLLFAILNPVICENYSQRYKISYFPVEIAAVMYHGSELLLHINP